MRTKISVLVAAAIGPFGLSLIPSVYSPLLFFYPLGIALGACCGLLWCALFFFYYAGSDGADRRRLRWLSLLAIVAFVVPVHVLLIYLGVSPSVPTDFAPP